MKNLKLSRWGYETFDLLGYNVVKFVEGQPKFRRNMSLSSSGSKNKLKETSMKQVSSRRHVSFKTLVIFQRNTWRYTAEEKTLHKL
jgi:hypothetical protein